MDTQADNQAMTEVALGLAMAFFALMVLSMVSMSVQPAQAMNRSVEAVTAQAQLKPDADNTVKTVIGDQDEIIIFYQGRFLDTDLQPLSMDSLPKAKRYVLALSPDMPFDEVLIARKKISASNLIITELDPAWLQRLTQ